MKWRCRSTRDSRETQICAATVGVFARLERNSIYKGVDDQLDRISLSSLNNIWLKKFPNGAPK